MSKPILNYVVNKALKRLSIGTYSKKGRNSFGRICVFHRGGGNVRKYRLIDFSRRLNVFGYVFKILYDPNRTGFIGLIFYETGFFSFIVLADGINLGAKLFSGNSIIEDEKYKQYMQGSAMPLYYINLFNVVNCVELIPGLGGQLTRAAGAGAIIISKANNKAVLKLRSGWLITVSLDCMASIGSVSNHRHSSISIRKAGKNRGLGIRPTVRGVAMNPCDHPHGGGNGKSSPPRAPVSPWGKMTKGPHTKNTKADKLKRKLFKKLR